MTHAPDTMSQNEPESRNGFITISLHFIGIPKVDIVTHEGGSEGGNLWFIEVLTHLKK